MSAAVCTLDVGEVRIVLDRIREAAALRGNRLYYAERMLVAKLEDCVVEQPPTEPAKP